MAEITITGPGHLPGAEDPTSPAISFGEGATDAMLEFLRSAKDFHVQITTAAGSFAARIDDVTTDDRSIYSIVVTRIEDMENEVFADEQELVPLDQLRRVHVW